MFGHRGAPLSLLDRIETYTTFQLDSQADCQKVFAWYDEQLKLAGFNVGDEAPPVRTA